ncbi:hypothetical protein AALB39_09855 [Lachnospiraceae bacterium 54-53]
MKHSKKTYRYLGLFFQLCSLLVLLLSIVLIIASQRAVFFGGLFIFIILLAAGTVFHDKANHWRPIRDDSVPETGYICNVSVQSGERGYRVVFDLKNSRQTVKERVTFLTTDKLLADSLLENSEIRYRLINDSLFFPEIGERISMM